MGYRYGIMDIRFGIGFFQPFIIRLEVNKAKEIFREYICEKFCGLSFIKKNTEILITADAVMVFAFRTNR